MRAGILAGKVDPIAEPFANRFQEACPSLRVPLAQAAKMTLIEAIVNEFCKGLLLKAGRVQIRKPFGSHESGDCG
jgi:hypothetical protein